MDCGEMMDEKFVRKLLSNMKCGICGCQYDSGNIKILGHREDLWFLSVFCPSCKSQGLVAAVVKAEGRCEILTELTEEERRKLDDEQKAFREHLEKLRKAKDQEEFDKMMALFFEYAMSGSGFSLA